MTKIITTFTSRKDSTKVYTLVEFINEGTTAVLADSEGSNHHYALSTLKRNFKKTVTEVEVEEPKKEEPTKMNHHQQVAQKQVKATYSWIVGGHENSLADGNVEELPSVEDMFEEVLSETYTCRYESDCVYTEVPAPASMNFAGKQFVVNVLVGLFLKDGYEVPEHLRTVKTKKSTGVKRSYKGEVEHLEEDEVAMRAFTGMLIGIFKVTKKNKSQVAVKTAAGVELWFDTKTGKQLNAVNPKFANFVQFEAAV